MESVKTCHMSPEDPRVPGPVLGEVKEDGEERREEELESPLVPPTLEAWGRVLPPGPRHSRAMQVGEEVEMGDWSLMPARMAL